jgi:hypothetical protein
MLNKERQMKYLHMTFENGETWQFPAYLVARERAHYYAESDTGETRGAEYDRVRQEEFDITMNDDSELLDYLHNNMEWSQVKDYAVLVPKDPTPYNYAREFANAPTQVVEVNHEPEN